MRRPTARLANMAALIWCGVTRRVRSTALPLLILAGISLISTEVGAGSITYNVVNYPSLQNGYTVSGTIITNATTGTSLPSTDISSWDIKITMGSTTEAEFTPANGPVFGTFDATLTAITNDIAGLDQLSFEETNGYITWIYAGTFGITYAATISSVNLWNTAEAGNGPSLIATAQTVPEPSSAVLAVIGAGSVVACGLVRRRRAQRRPSDAGHTQPTE